MSKVFSGHQPNLLPYMGVFYKIFQSDVFVLDDDVQYSSKGLHNANFLKVNGSKYKFTVPVTYEYGDNINEVKISYSKNWDETLMKTLKNSYSKAPHFEEAYNLMERHLSLHKRLLIELNYGLIEEISRRFKLNSELLIASKAVPTTMKKNERNVFQCKSLGCDVYYSGVGGKDYNDEEMYAENGIQVVYSDYEPVKYSQGKGEFVENLSVLDYIMFNGFELPEYWTRKHEKI